jgi:signal transduction histidine kinase/ActR/RegA family two-component response regulator
MQTAPHREDESNRLAFLHSLDILDTEPEERFDSITRLACQLLGADFAAVSLIDTDRQWFKSQRGLDVASTSRDVSFCAHNILDDQTMVVEEALIDPRFYDNGLVTGAPHLRAYMGHPLSVTGVSVGALCVLYTAPRSFSNKDKATLRDLARLTEEMIAHGRFRKTVGEDVSQAMRASDIVLSKAIQLNSEPTLLIELRNRTITDLNEACADELGGDADALRGKPMSFDAKPLGRTVLELADEIERSGKLKDIEICIRPDSCNPAEFLCSAHAVHYAGAPHLLISGRNISNVKRRESLLKKALNATGGKTDRDYFESCARVMSEVLDVRYGMLVSTGGSGSPSASVIAFWDRNSETANLPALDGELEFGSGTCDMPQHVPSGFAYKFPQRRSLAAMGVESYFAHPVCSAEGDLRGHLVVMDTEPYIDASCHAALLLGTFASRTAAEMERRDMHQNLKDAKIRAEVASHAKSSFLANMSHELRTPMNSILGFTQLMAQDDSLNDDQKGTLKIVNDSGEHLLCLINDVLEMSKIEAGQIIPVPEKIWPTTLMRGIESMLSTRAGEKSLSLQVSIDPEVPQVVELDGGKTRQILVNLVGNAIKFTDVGHIRFRLGLNKDASTGGRCLRFEIGDSGKGIPASALEKLFQPFEQVDRQKGLEGTGLGLSICKGYADAMGGTIAVSSAVGLGSTFILKLPLVAVKDETGLTDYGIDRLRCEIPVTAAARGDIPIRILIVDDIDPGRLLLRRLLAPLGAELREAKNGVEALEVEEEWHPDVIFMDLRMPLMDGDEATTLIKARRGATAPAIIAITASVFRDSSTVEDTPFDGYITKPFRIEELMEELETHLGGIAGRRDGLTA